MMVNNRGSIWRLLYWQWRRAVLFTSAAVLVVFVHDVFGFERLGLPTLPLAVVGAAIGIFVSFRTNSCYDRWWEGRKLWGRLINTSRHWATQAVTYFPDAETRQRLVRRQIAYVHVLRCVLRGQNALADPEVRTFLTQDEQEALNGRNNQNHALLVSQSQDLVAHAQAGRLTEFRLQSMDESLRALLDIQGGCERIKKTPFPRGYGFIADRLVFYYAFLFPLAVVDDLSWFTVPISLLVTMSFALIGEAGRVLEDPFTLFYNGLPLMAMSKTIERNLREALGDKELPEIPKPNADGILM